MPINITRHEIKNYSNNYSKFKMNFQLRGKHFFFTYPQCPVSHKVALEQLTLKFEPATVELYSIAQEKHKDGNTHLHAYIKTKEQFSTRKPAHFDLFEDTPTEFNTYHGNYQTCRSAKAVLEYVQKDGNVLTNISSQGLPKVDRKSMAKDIIENRQSLSEMVSEYPQLLFNYKRLKLDLIELNNDKYKPQIREVKAYWYYGATRLGKSWKALTTHTPLLLEYDMETRKPKLAGDFNMVYFKNSQNKWFDGYSGQRYVFIDELPIEANKWILNYVKQWTDKLPYQPEIKGARCWAQWDTVVITCQHSPSEFFAGAAKADVDAILARLEVHHITMKQF